MELEILKKKLSSFRGDGGRIRNVNDELLMEVLHAWENWTGTAMAFYKGIGCSQKGMASMIGKAKRLKREGHVSEFTEVKVEEQAPQAPVRGINVRWEKGKVIQFPSVDTLVEFLQKVA